MGKMSRRLKKRVGRLTFQDFALFAVVGVLLVGSSYTMDRIRATPTAAIVHATLPSPSPVSPAVRHNALFIGDSYTAGAGGGGAFTGEACLTARAMNWRCSLDAQVGTGFVADGQTSAIASTHFAAVGARLAATKQSYPSSDIVLVDVGRDDGRVDRATLELAAADYLKNLRLAYPQAALVLIVPYYITSQAPPLGPEFTTFLTAQAALYQATVIDPFAGGWISPALTGSLAGDDGIHPSAAGHSWIASHLASALRAAKIGV